MQKNYDDGDSGDGNDDVNCSGESGNDDDDSYDDDDDDNKDGDCSNSRGDDEDVGEKVISMLDI